MYPQYTVPYQQPPNQLMTHTSTTQNGAVDVLGSGMFYYAFTIMAIALLVVAGMYAYHKWK